MFELLDHRAEEVASQIHALFQQGRGTRLLQALLERIDWRTATVETAAGNLPAVALYEKTGFSVSGSWTTAEGIEKVGLTQSHV